MSLNVGELVAYMGLEASKFDEGLAGTLDKFKEHGNRLTKLAAGIGAGSAIALGAALSGAMDVQEAGSKLAAQLGRNAEGAKELGAEAGHLYSQNFGDSLDEVGDALGLVYRNIDEANSGIGGPAVEALTGKVLNLSKVFGQDLEGTTRAVGQMIRTGMAKDANEALDILTTGFQMGNDKAGDLLDTVNEYGTEFRKLGIDGSQAMGLITEGLQAGARDSDKVADALKEFSIRAVDGSKLTADGFKMIGLNAGDMSERIGKGGKSANDALQLTLDRLRGIKDPVQQAQAATALFGTQAEDLGAALFALDPKGAVDTIGSVGGAADKMGKTLNDNAKSNLESFKRQAMMTFVDVLGGKVLPKVTEATSWLKDHLGPAVKAVTEWMSKHKDVIGPVATVLGILVGVILLVAGAVKAWSIIQAVLNLELWANPVGLIVLAIIALIAIIVIIATKTHWFQDIWHAVWSGIKTAAEAVAHWFMNDFVGSFVRAYDWIKDKVGEVKDWIVGKWNDVVSFVTGLPGRIRSAAAGMWDGFKDAYRSALNWIIGKWNGLHFKIPGISIPGIGQVWGGADLRVPQIPQLAAGGIVRATPGGRTVQVAEGGQDEAVIPLDRLRSLLGDLVVVFDTKGDAVLDALFRVIRPYVRVKFGGSIERAAKMA